VRRATLSTPSLGITSAVAVTQEGDGRESFNSLSRDHFQNVTTTTLDATNGFQLPLSGSQDNVAEANIGRVADLSTPSLGITGYSW
jgi:hypothetical protein